MPSAETLEPLSTLFTGQFSRLVVLLRREPANVLSQKEALRSAMASLHLHQGVVRVEAGVEYSAVPDEETFKGRLLLRYVDTVHFAADASAADVLSLARALADDQAPIPSTANVRVEQVPLSAARRDTGVTAPRMDLPNDHQRFTDRVTSSGRTRTMSGPVEEADQLRRAFEAAVGQLYWTEALYATQALIRLTARFPEHERRGYVLAIRRLFSRDILEKFIHHAMCAAEDQSRVIEVLQIAGPEAIELMVDHICRSETVGPRKFIHDVLAATPDALPMLLPLLASSRWHEVRHGAELLGRLGLPAAIGPLREVLTHKHAKVRQTAVEALAKFNEHGVVEPIRRALADSSPATRASAAQALAQRNSAGLATPILHALETERDPETWDALVAALASIDCQESMAALVALALDRGSLLKPRSSSQRVGVVMALAAAGHAGAYRALDRLVREGSGAVRATAIQSMRDLAIPKEDT
jgi:hypothetical protein